MPYEVQDPVGTSSSAARPIGRVISRITNSRSVDQQAGRPYQRKIVRAGEGIGPPLPQDLCCYPSRIWICALRARALRPTYPPFLLGRSVNQTDHPPISHILSPNPSGRRDSNPRHQPWQGCTLPTELRPRLGKIILLPADPCNPISRRQPEPFRPPGRPKFRGSGLRFAPPWPRPPPSPSGPVPAGCSPR